MTATPDTAPVEKIPLLVWGQKCLIYKGLLQCSSAPVPITGADVEVATAMAGSALNHAGNFASVCLGRLQWRAVITPLSTALL